MDRIDIFRLTIGGISEIELRIILSHVCDYDVIKLDGELPRAIYGP